MSADGEPLVMRLNINDWRQAVRNPPSYRIGNNTVRLQSRFVCVIAAAGVAILLYFYYIGLTPSNDPNEMLVGSNALSSGDLNTLDVEHGHAVHTKTGGQAVGAGEVPQGRMMPPPSYYNRTYPLTKAITTPKGIAYKVYIISDLDKASKSKIEEDTWESHLRHGVLTYNSKDVTASLDWDEKETLLKSGMSSGGRGMELSELVVFNGKMYTVDDRTGIVYEMEDLASKPRVVPWIILSDGNGHESKVFKSEWATVKNQELYIGGLGKEWTTPDGQPLHLNPQWVKIISPTGVVRHVDWHVNYDRLKRAAGIDKQGYMIHEAVVWSDILQRWVFLPRRASPNRYDEKDDERRGTNFLLMATDDFSDIKVSKIGDVVLTHGFSSCKFIPDTDDQIIVALKSEEDDGRIASYATVFDVKGTILMPETKIGDYKFEGIEFG